MAQCQAAKRLVTGRRTSSLQQLPLNVVRKISRILKSRRVATELQTRYARNCIHVGPTVYEFDELGGELGFKGRRLALESKQTPVCKSSALRFPEVQANNI